MSACKPANEGIKRELAIKSCCRSTKNAIGPARTLPKVRKTAQNRLFLARFWSFLCAIWTREMALEEMAEWREWEKAVEARERN
jgi:hypothetical protein